MSKKVEEAKKPQFIKLKDGETPKQSTYKGDDNLRGLSSKKFTLFLEAEIEDGVKIVPVVLTTPKNIKTIKFLGELDKDSENDSVLSNIEKYISIAVDDFDLSDIQKDILTAESLIKLVGFMAFISTKTPS